VKLLITDLDGTLLMEDDQVHPDDHRAVRALKAHGVQVSIATGRLYSGTRPTCRTLRLLGPVGCADGSQLVDATDDQPLQVHALPTASVEWLLGVDAAPYAFADDTVHHDRRGAEHLRYISTWTNQIHAHPDLAAVSRLREAGSTKVFVLLGGEAAVQAARERALAEGLSVIAFAFGGGLGLVVRRGGVDKGTAVEFIARRHGVSLEHVAVVGDWLNDVPMLLRAGHRFVMGHAIAEVKAHAHHVLPTSGPGRALAHVAEHFGVPL
jgi:Cof subfamily protein (haloacid dehalogenase superfamily)